MNQSGFEKGHGGQWAAFEARLPPREGGSGGSGKDALDMHVEQQIYQHGESEEPDCYEGNEVNLAADGFQIFE